MLLAAAGLGLSGMGWIAARREHHQNLLDGINGSIGMTALWRIGRERSRFYKQLVILTSGLFVTFWRMQYADVPLVFEIYVTRNLTLLVISALLMLDAITDRHNRRAITEVIRHEQFRLAGRRSTDPLVTSKETAVSETTITTKTITP